MELNSFRNIVASSDGGVLRITDSNGRIASNLFENVEAADSKGGAIYYESSPSLTYITNNTFKNCQALSGNAVYWNAEEPTLEGNSFIGDEAASHVASYAHHLGFLEPAIGEAILNHTYKGNPPLQTRVEFRGVRSGGFLPSVYLGMFDKYD